VTIDLWMLRIAGGKPQGLLELVKPEFGQIANHDRTAYTRSPITRDGALYFVGDSPQSRELMSVEFDPATGKAVGNPSYVAKKGGASFSPSFSRDGRLLAYISGEQGSPQSIVIHSVESGEERSIPNTPAGARLFWAVISPDGRSLLVDARLLPRNELEIYRVDMAGGAWTSVTKAREGEPIIIPYAISPDGKAAYVFREQMRTGASSIYHLTALNLETLQERELVSVGWNGAVAVSPDGKQLAVARMDGKEAVIHIQPIERGPEREVYRRAGGQLNVTTWTPDGRYVIISQDPGATQPEDYLMVPVEGGAAQPVGIPISKDNRAQFPRSLGGASMSPGRRQLIFTVRGEAETWWVLENFLPDLRASAK
jgi:dipeptidyl aminopeptidase/acylaminoacyl peptidase